MNVRIYAPGDQEIVAWDGGHLLLVTPVGGPTALESPDSGLLDLIQEVCRERGIPVRFVGGQFGGAGTTVVGPLLRVAGVLLRWGLSILSRYRRKRSFRDSALLAWGSSLSYSLTLEPDTHDDADPHFVAQILAMVAEVERRHREKWGADFAINSSLVASKRLESGDLLQPLLNLTIEPDALRATGFSRLYKLSKEAVRRQQEGRSRPLITRGVISDRPVLARERKNATKVNDYLLYVTSDGESRDKVPVEFRPARDV